MFSFLKRKTLPLRENIEARIVRYRSGGRTHDGLHILKGYQVDDLDYALQGADNSCAEINFPGIQITMGQWFAIKPGTALSKRHFYNSHSTNGITESAYLSIPRLEYRTSPAEVVWHYQRVTELRKQNVEQPERVRIMLEERASKPWLKQQAA